MVAAVDGDRLTRAVHDPSAARRDQDHLEPIALRQQLVTLILGDGEPGHAAGEESRESALQPAQHQRAPGKGVGLAVLSDEGNAPIHRDSRHLSRPRTIRATSGKARTDAPSCGAITAKATLLPISWPISQPLHT